MFLREKLSSQKYPISKRHFVKKSIYRNKHYKYRKTDLLSVLFIELLKKKTCILRKESYNHLKQTAEY